MSNQIAAAAISSRTYEKHDALMWKLQRAGWAAWLVILMLAIAGIYGHGFLERTSIALSDAPAKVSFLQGGSAVVGSGSFSVRR